MIIKQSIIIFFASWIWLGTAAAKNGLILDQQLNDRGQGYTVLRVWGSYHDMGYAQANLLGDFIVYAVSEMKNLADSQYKDLRLAMKDAVWMPPAIENELEGMVGSLAITHSSANIDKIDLMVLNAYGDWGYACRSHMCWGRYVSSPIQTLATRRLDFGSPIPTSNHHVLCARNPSDGSPQWVNLGWPGSVLAVTGLNEYGVLVSLHDYNSSDVQWLSGRMPRSVACRYAITFMTSSHPSTHLFDTFAEMEGYEIMTGSFINYYAPNGHGGVMACNPYQNGPDFYHLRTPQKVWHHGEAIITTNAWTDGTYTPSDEDFGADPYYHDESPKTLESHWTLLASNSSALHQLSVAYRGRGDMTIWADGRLDEIGRTSRLEWEWADLFGEKPILSISECGLIFFLILLVGSVLWIKGQSTRQEPM